LGEIVEEDWNLDVLNSVTVRFQKQQNLI